MKNNFSAHDVVEGIGGAALIGIHILLFPFLRGYRSRWGLTPEEASADLPGDELIPNPALRISWGITVNAPIEAVWPWIVQIGQGRGGFYSYQFLENIVGCEVYNADRILPEHQRLPLETGVSLADGTPPMKIARHEDGRYYFLQICMDMTTMETFNPKQDSYPDMAMCGGWGFYLQKIDESRTRFVSRWLAGLEPTLINKIACIFLEAIGFVMGRKMLLGVKQRAERKNR